MAYFDWGKCYCYLDLGATYMTLSKQVVCSWWKAPLPLSLGLSGNRGEAGMGGTPHTGARASGESSRPVIARVTLIWTLEGAPRTPSPSSTSFLAIGGKVGTRMS